MGERYNIGGHNEKRNIDIVKLILNHLGKPESLISYVEDRKGHDYRYAIDPTKLKTELKEMKYGVLDLDVELESGEIVNVEMQLKDYRNIENRTTFYASKKIVEQLEPKGKYEELKRVIVIAILDYTLTDLPEYITEEEEIITYITNIEN